MLKKGIFLLFIFQISFILAQNCMIPLGSNQFVSVGQASTDQLMQNSDITTSCWNQVSPEKQNELFMKDFDKFKGQGRADQFFTKSFGKPISGLDNAGSNMVKYDGNMIKLNTQVKSGNLPYLQKGNLPSDITQIKATNNGFELIGKSNIKVETGTIDANNVIRGTGTYDGAKILPNSDLRIASDGKIYLSKGAGVDFGNLKFNGLENDAFVQKLSDSHFLTKSTQINGYDTIAKTPSLNTDVYLDSVKHSGQFVQYDLSGKQVNLGGRDLSFEFKGNVKSGLSNHPYFNKITGNGNNLKIINGDSVVKIDNGQTKILRSADKNAKLNYKNIDVLNAQDLKSKVSFDDNFLSSASKSSKTLVNSGEGIRAKKIAGLFEKKISKLDFKVGSEASDIVKKYQAMGLSKEQILNNPNFQKEIVSIPNKQLEVTSLIDAKNDFMKGAALNSFNDKATQLGISNTNDPILKSDFTKFAKITQDSINQGITSGDKMILSTNDGQGFLKVIKTTGEVQNYNFQSDKIVNSWIESYINNEKINANDNNLKVLQKNLMTNLIK